MKVVFDLPFFESGCAAALGTFDGVHLGHRQVISAVTDCGYVPVVVMILQGDRKKRIFSDELNIKYIERLGVDTVVCLSLDDIRDMSAESYISMLYERMNIKRFACGCDHRFGKNADGSSSLIADFANEHGVEFISVGEVKIDGVPVSSTAVRSLIANGDMPSARKMLGHDYELDFEVVHGDARGRKMGFPTVNQVYPDGLVLPKFGVYASSVTVGEKRMAAVTNVGVRPTFLTDRPLAETHIIGYSGDLYGKKPSVTLNEFLRGEHRFDSLEELCAAIDADKNRSIKVFEKT